MGLDMYAHRRYYVKKWEHQKPEEQYEVSVTRGGKPVPHIKSDALSTIEEEVMYWRKANHIHAWFVENVQGGEDNCGQYYVDEEELKHLHEACSKVLENSKSVDGQVNCGEKFEEGKLETIWRAGKVIEDPTTAKQLLPTKEGFFFGHYEYDEDYLHDVKETLAWTTRMLEDRKNGNPGRIYYSSSW